MANTLLFTLSRELDANGVTVPGAKAYFYEAGTTTPITAYSDQAATIAHPSPLEADAGGLFAACYVTASTAKVVITKADDSALRTIDPAPIVSLSGVGASGVSFVPTVDIPETNVQDAIEAAAASAASGFAAFGLGVTGNAPDLANIDATNIGVGFYRATASTTGTFPTGITAAGTSIVRVERETSALAVMTLMDDSGKVFQRFMVASAWGAWRHLVTMPAAPTTGDIPNWTGSAWAAVAAGASRTALISNGAGVVPSYQAMKISGSLTLSGASANTSGIFDGGDIPSWVTTIHIFLNAVSQSGAADMQIRLSVDASQIASGHGGISDIQHTTGFGILGTESGGQLTGLVTMVRTTAAVGLTGGGYSTLTGGAGMDTSGGHAASTGFNRLYFIATAGTLSGSVLIVLS
jgi:hypothetical protein